ncbi:MAG: Zn-dependent exopeptidase M28 [Oscillospiraceae bacterium]|jgi:hypothetical protein|nr:Zn-dependent exopeptidase M28 [Oscillospiraceae bacterium]
MSLQPILKNYPIRNSESEKEAFRAWAVAQAEDAGVPAAVETLGEHRNIVMGDLENARVLFTAHYDTPKRALFPNLMLPTHRALAVAYQFAVLMPIIALGLLAFHLVLGGDLGRRAPAALAFMVVYYGLWFLMTRAGKNRSNANDNSSGVAAVMMLLRALPAPSREGVAFVLFDNEEKGKRGSKAFAKAHTSLKESALCINLDCIGHGKHLLAVVSEQAMAGKAYPALEGALQNVPGMQTVFLNHRHAKLNSDQMHFRHSVGLAACLKSRRGLYYTPRIHTSRDTIADDSNIAAISDALRTFCESNACRSERDMAMLPRR